MSESVNWLDWLAEVRGELAGHPESIEGPDGNDLSVGYRSDALRDGAEYAVLGVYQPQWPLEIAPGLVLDEGLPTLRVYLTEPDEENGGEQ